MTKTQFTIYLKNQPGALAGVLKTLARSGVNIEGLSAATSADVGIVQIVVDGALSAEKALKKSRIPYSIQKVAMVTLTNRPGELARVTAKLAREGVNLNYIYGTACHGKCDATLVVSAPELRKVERTWR
jgi:hypothetical protein